MLIIDNPPGTGDIPLTILQTLPSLDGVVIVTTPQSIVQEDVIKNINLVKSLNVPIIGIIENMSGFICPHCKKEIFIFGKDDGAKIAEEMDIPFLGKLPLDVKTSSSSDIGNPIIFKEPESEISKKIFDIVNKIENTVLKKGGSV